MQIEHHQTNLDALPRHALGVRRYSVFLLSEVIDMRAFIATIAATVFCFPFSSASQEESRWSWETRFGVNTPIDDLGPAELETGIGFEASILYRLQPGVSAYFGWGWDRFESDGGLTGQTEDIEETGYNFGLQLMGPLGNRNLDYFLRLGGIFNHIELEDNDGDIVADSDHGLGWQVGAGLVFSMGDSWRLTPGVRFQTLSRDLAVNEVRRDVELEYLEFGIGLSRSF